MAESPLDQIVEAAILNVAHERPSHDPNHTALFCDWLYWQSNWRGLAELFLI